MNTPVAHSARIIKWYRTPIDRSSLESLLARSDAKGFLYTFFHIALLLLTGSTSYYLLNNNHILWGTLALAAHGSVCSFLGWGGASHELSHNTVFRTKSLNTLFLRLFSFLTWNNYIYFRASHSRHHKSTVYDGQDFEVRLPQQIQYRSWIYALTFDFPAFWRALRITTENSLGIIRGGWGNELFPQHNSKSRSKLFNWARIILCGHLFLAALFITTGKWSLLFIVTLAPFICTWPNKILSQAQHFGMQPNVPDFRKNSRTILLNPFLAFLYWQMNYHVEHHMYPAVPFFNLKKLRKTIEHDLPEPTHGIRGAVKEMIEIQKRQY